MLGQPATWQRLEPFAPLASLPLDSASVSIMPDVPGVVPLLLTTTKSLPTCQRPSSLPTATAKAAIAAFVPSRLVQLITPCSAVPSSSVSSTDISSSPASSPYSSPSSSTLPALQPGSMTVAATAIERTPAVLNQLLFMT